jgi:hypothetical protein
MKKLSQKLKNKQKLNHRKGAVADELTQVKQWVNAL